jgi:hypothetical protein
MDLEDLSKYISIDINKNNLIEKILKNCNPRCRKCYQYNKIEINNILEKYKKLLPLIFCHDLQEIKNNKFAEIINEIFGVYHKNGYNDYICTSCLWYIVQSYNFNKKELLERYFIKPTGFSKKSLCYN